MRVFITGITGFAGGHLAEHCLSVGAEVAGLARTATESLLPPSVRGNVALHAADLCVPDALERALRSAAPDYIFHLAAETASHSPAAQLFRTNVLGSLNLLRAAASLDRRPTILVASSSAVYGHVDQPETPIDEEVRLSPASPYGLAKAAQDALCDAPAAWLGLDVVRARAFNHTGPRERDSFFASAMARQIAEAETGRAEPCLRVGRLDTRRDFSDVRDIVRGYFLAATRGRAGGVYNLASGTAIPMQAILETLAALSRVPVKIEVDPERVRPADIACQIGNSGKAQRELDWSAGIDLKQSLADLLDHWRSAVS